jgi:hypothetical protein
MTTIDTRMNPSRTMIGRLAAIGLLAFSLVACGAAADEPAETVASAAPEVAPAAAAEPAPVAEAERGGKEARGKHGRRGAKDPARMMERLDANGDGKLAVSELPERAQRRFGDADQDRDGFLSVEEIKARVKKGGKERFAKLDADGDGFVTKDEAGEKRWDRMKVADANGDDKVTVEELKAAHESGKLKGKRQRRGEGRPQGQAPAQGQ